MYICSMKTQRLHQELEQPTNIGRDFYGVDGY
ncbi:hypothetical protein PANI_CDS0063 [Maribacter phage Panino]